MIYDLCKVESTYAMHKYQHNWVVRKGTWRPFRPISLFRTQFDKDIIEQIQTPQPFPTNGSLWQLDEKKTKHFSQKNPKVVFSIQTRRRSIQTRRNFESNKKTLSRCFLRWGRSSSATTWSWGWTTARTWPTSPSGCSSRPSIGLQLRNLAQSGQQLSNHFISMTNIVNKQKHLTNLRSRNLAQVTFSPTQTPIWVWFPSNFVNTWSYFLGQMLSSTIQVFYYYLILFCLRILSRTQSFDILV